jgi:hypothetical protein
MEIAKESNTTRKLSEIVESHDRYFLKSREYLRTLILRSLKKVFTGALSSIEINLGTEFPQYQMLRSEILRIGNDAIRDMHQYLNKFNIEMIPEVVEVLLSEGKRQGVQNNGTEKIE